MSHPYQLDIDSHIKANVLLLVLCSSVAINGRSSATADRLRTLVGKKNLEITKITDHFSHAHKKDFKTAKLERSFFF